MGAITIKLSKSEWLEVKAMAESKGHSDKELAAQWGVSRESIRKRRHDDAARGEPWKTPKQKEEELAIKAVKNFYQRKESGEGLGVELDMTPVTEDHLMEMRSQTPQILARRIHVLLREGIGMLRAPTNLDDFNKMYSLYQKMLGLDKKEGGISISVSGGMNWGSSKAEKPVVILEAVEA